MPGTCAKCGADISQAGGLATNGGVEMCEPCFALYAPDMAVGMRLNPPAAASRAPSRAPVPAGSPNEGTPGGQVWLTFVLGLSVLSALGLAQGSYVQAVVVFVVSVVFWGLVLGVGALMYRALNRKPGGE